MTQLIAVTVAVGDLLTRLGWWPPRNLEAVLGDDYLFDQDSMSDFLSKVRHKLETGIGEAYTFDFDAKFVKTALKSQVDKLIGDIDDVAKTIGRNNLLQAELTAGKTIARTRSRTTVTRRRQTKGTTGKI